MERKLTKFLAKRVEEPSGQQRLTPLLLSDSKGCCLQGNGSRTEELILVRGRGGRNVSQALEWLQSNLAEEVEHRGPLSVYIWLGTCDLTSRDKSGCISLVSLDNSTVQNIAQKYQEIVQLFKSFPRCKVTFLEVPVYSITHWNQFKKHKDPSVFGDQDKQLVNQILELNTIIHDLNSSIGCHSPNFCVDLYRLSKKITKKNYGASSSSKTMKSYAFNLYKDGIHPRALLSKVWMKKITFQVITDCWL